MKLCQSPKNETFGNVGDRTLYRPDALHAGWPQFGRKKFQTTQGLSTNFSRSIPATFHLVTKYLMKVILKFFWHDIKTVNSIKLILLTAVTRLQNTT